MNVHPGLFGALLGFSTFFWVSTCSQVVFGATALPPAAVNIHSPEVIASWGVDSYARRDRYGEDCIILRDTLPAKWGALPDCRDEGAQGGPIGGWRPVPALALFGALVPQPGWLVVGVIVPAAPGGSVGAPPWRGVDVWPPRPRGPERPGEKPEAPPVAVVPLPPAALLYIGAVAWIGLGSAGWGFVLPYRRK